MTERCKREHTRASFINEKSLVALRRERCERDFLNSDSAQFPATSAIASASSRASLLQEVHTGHQEPVSDHERHPFPFDQYATGPLSSPEVWICSAIFHLEDRSEDRDGPSTPHNHIKSFHAIHIKLHRIKLHHDITTQHTTLQYNKSHRTKIRLNKINIH